MTCIDVIAGVDEKWSTFDEWLSRELGKNPEELPEYLNKGIYSLKETESPKEIQKSLKEWIDNDLREQYLNTFGVTRNFKRFIHENMPAWLERWISTNYYLRKGDVNNNIQLVEFFYRDPKEKIVLLSNYYFYLRNTYTHTVEYVEPHEEDQIKYYLQPGNEFHKPSIDIRKIHEDSDNNKPVIWTIGATIDIAESEIARIVLITQLRNKVLRITDDQDFLTSFQNRQKYSYFGYKFMYELKSFGSSLRDLQYRILSSNDSRAGRKRIIPFQLKYGKGFLELHNTMYPHLQDKLWPSLMDQQPSFHNNYYPEMSEINLREYLDLVEDFNIKIQNDTSELISSENIHKLCSYTECIGRDLHNRLNSIAY